jgi:hypothetical protein
VHYKTRCHTIDISTCWWNLYVFAMIICLRLSISFVLNLLRFWKLVETSGILVLSSSRLKELLLRTHPQELKAQFVQKCYLQSFTESVACRRRSDLRFKELFRWLEIQSLHFEATLGSQIRKNCGSWICFYWSYPRSEVKWLRFIYLIRFVWVPVEKILPFVLIIRSFRINFEMEEGTEEARLFKNMWIT